MGQDKIDLQFERVKSLSGIRTLNHGPEVIVREILANLPVATGDQRTELRVQAEETLSDVDQATLDNGDTPQGLRDWRPFTSEEIQKLLNACEQVVGPA